MLGGPGSGKGTNCGKLVNDYGLVHLSAGDLLRAERDSGSPNGELINNIILKGEIVPVEITVNLIKTAMEKAGGAKKKFLIDGFPRNEDNLDGWNKTMSDYADIKFVLFLECEEQAMIDRINKRAAESAGQVRNDDNIEVLKKRFKTFRDQSMPIVNGFEKKGKVKRINSNQDPEKVYAEVQAAFEGYLDKGKEAQAQEPKTIKANPQAVQQAINTPRSEEGQNDGSKAESNASLYAIVAVTAAVAVVTGYYFFARQSVTS